MVKERNYGIDLLRIVSMFFVIILHSLGRGGLLGHTIINSSQYKTVWLLEIIAFCAVDIFALISGYVSYNKKTKLKNYFKLWFTVVYYCLLIVLIYQIINPDIIKVNDYVKAFFPVTNNSYWYFTAYTGLFILKPLIDKGINCLETKDLKKIFIAIIIVFSFFATITKRFSLGGGYSVIWLVLLYILGAIISKCEMGKKIKSYYFFMGIVFLVSITFLIKICCVENSEFFINYFNITVNGGDFVNYTSPTILGIAILFVIGFSKIKFNSLLKKIIIFGAPSAFAVYLINTNYLVWNNYMLNLFIGISNSSVFTILYKVLGFSLLFVIFSILIDKIRIFIFNILNIDKLCERISKFLSKLLNKWG